MTTTDPLLQRLGALDSTVLSDALDGLGLPAGLGALRPVWGAPRIVGRARTIELEPDSTRQPSSARSPGGAGSTTSGW